MDAADGRFTEVRRLLVRARQLARDGVQALRSNRLEPRGKPGRRSHQELAETAMALLTLWTTFDDAEAERVAATTRTLLAGHTAEELGYLVLHLAGLSRGMTRVLAASGERDIGEALQTVARDVQERRSTD